MYSTNRLPPYRYGALFLLISLMLTGCGVFEIRASVERVDPVAAIDPSEEPSSTSIDLATPIPQPTGTAIASGSAADVGIDDNSQSTPTPIPSISVQSSAIEAITATPFAPYPVQSSDRQSILVDAGVEMVPVYSGPGDTFPQAAAIPDGFTLGVSGMSEDGRWVQLAGCQEQNPFRPAPSCWISADVTSTQSPPSGPSAQQPMLPTDKQAVLVVSQEMAPVYGGPGETYPLISQLAGGFSFKITGMSEDGNWWRLQECSSPLNEVLTDCWISSDSGVTQALDALIPQGPQSSEQPTAVPPTVAQSQRVGTRTITELPKCFNLDTGEAGAESNPNCEFDLYPHDAMATLVFAPIAPARFGFGGVFPEAPTEGMCAGSQHLSGNSEVIAPLAMHYACYQTGEGRFGYLHFLDMTDEPLTVTLEWHTFQ